MTPRTEPWEIAADLEAAASSRNKKTGVSVMVNAVTRREKELMKALEPFARVLDEFNPEFANAPDNHWLRLAMSSRGVNVETAITIGHLRRARQALSGAGELS